MRLIYSVAAFTCAAMLVGGATLPENFTRFMLPNKWSKQKNLESTVDRKSAQKHREDWLRGYSDYHSPI